jgi:hypothetical protein
MFTSTLMIPMLIFMSHPPTACNDAGARTGKFLRYRPDSAALWKAQVAHFSGRFRTVVVRFPAFGNDRASAGVDFPVLAKRLAATLGALATPRPPHVVVVGRDRGAY